MRMYVHALIFVWTLLQEYKVRGARITCGQRVIHAEEHQVGQFQSPGYPLGYPNNLDCEWIIQAPEGQQVEIMFLRIFTESCCDTVELRDGNSSTAGLLATYRGEVTESVYASSFGSLYIKFTSDESYVDYGFVAEYRIATTKTKNCTMELQATNGIQTLSSPGWPHRYENNLMCSWTIVAPKDQRVEINFTEFSTEGCCDYVLVRHGRSMFSRIFEFGGEINQPIIQVSPGNVLQVLFRSDSSVPRKGFTLEYKAVDRIQIPSTEPRKREKCGGKIEVPLTGHGILTTPRYPKKHDNNLNCVWVLVAPPQRRIMLWFTYIETETCCDFVKIRDGETPTSKKLGILSGTSMKFAHYTSTRNVLRVDFQSDLTTVGAGFRAVYEVLEDSSKESCGGKLLAVPGRRKYLSSPNWPRSPRSALCIWRITAPKGYSVVFQVIGFHSHQGRDKIRFFDGLSSNSFATIGGNTRYDDQTINTTSNRLGVLYRPDVTTRDAGFKAYYMAVPKNDSAAHKLPTRPGAT